MQETMSQRDRNLQRNTTFLKFFQTKQAELFPSEKLLRQLMP
jgi:hypothetical protein